MRSGDARDTLRSQKYDITSGFHGKFSLFSSQYCPLKVLYVNIRRKQKASSSHKTRSENWVYHLQVYPYTTFLAIANIFSRARRVKCDEKRP